MRRLLLTTALLIGGSVLAPASAQYYGYPTADGDHVYDHRRDLRRGRVRVSNACVTGRGSCPVDTMPVGTPCACYLAGFGYKRGHAW